MGARDIARQPFVQLGMDVFSRTFLPATSEAGLPIPVVSRHMPVLRRCVSPEETTVLVSRCQRPGLPVAGAHLLLLTNRRLVVSRESRLLRRVHLHLASRLRDLHDVTWESDEQAGLVELAVTVPEDTRQRFWLPLGDPLQVRHADALLSHALLRLRDSAGTGMLGAVPRAARHSRIVRQPATA